MSGIGLLLFGEVLRAAAVVTAIAAATCGGAPGYALACARATAASSAPRGSRAARTT